MEIDLELPICEHEMLKSGSSGNDVTDTACDIYLEEQSINPSSMTEHSKKVLSENAFCCQDQVDLNSNQVDAIDKFPFKEPQNGLEFESKEAAYSFYREYARSVGFGITIKASRCSKKSGKFIDIKIACSRFGSKRESGTVVNPRPCKKTGCKAGIHIKKKQDGNWIIYNFVKEHNHGICPDDFFRGSKQTSIVASQKKGMQLALEEGDVQSMIEYFVSMQCKNPNFFYAIDLDQNRHLRTVFWVDSKGRLDYQNFHDIVLIDTFYLRNKYKIPFVPFVGVNHHFQYILLGCALVGEETVSAFIWLMRAWLKAMSNLPPKVIITDQEQFLKEAVMEVFPDKRHCFCLSHILCKITKNLDYIIDQNNNFMGKFDKCIHHSCSDEQFEKRWWKLINRFELKNDEWVQSLYEDRKKWVPTFMQDISLAGLSTTVRYESISSSFDKYICVDSTFKEFIEQYKVFSIDSFDMEAKADFETKQKQPALRSLSPFEKQLSTIYTDAIFRKFQLEILGMMSCHLQKETEKRANGTFLVDDFEEQKKFIVSWKEADLYVSCSCCLFQYKGFLCRHAILVLQKSGITNIPSHYILKRWMKDAKANQFVGDVITRTAHRVQRFNDLCRQAIILSEIGSLSEDTYRVASQALEEIYKHCVNANNFARSTLESNKLVLNGFDVEEKNDGCHRAKPTKKRKSFNKRECSDPERINIKMLDDFQKREQRNTRAHNFDNCYISQQDIQTVDLDSRASTLDVYYGAQRNVLGDSTGHSWAGRAHVLFPRLFFPRSLWISFCFNIQGQLHSMPSRGSHYEMQHSMQRPLQGLLTFRTPTAMEQPIRDSQFHGITSKQLDVDKSLSS
ncbi:protein FAR1-RELATED SEQUENCE 2 isoform X3 [Glycine soja]|uniref:protein FAR1-RELATED SEQUENCE 2 isoform X3 n=1 Tax=Glycine soja TaxID=3848 RepID=UPI0010402690|nr:protein FAR1-RELATED SEQUENCE 2 isoform X3 [Glycine soja]